MHICAVWSDSSVGAFWIAKDEKKNHADNEDWSDCTDWFESSLAAHLKMLTLTLAHIFHIVHPAKILISLCELFG